MLLLIACACLSLRRYQHELSSTLQNSNFCDGLRLGRLPRLLDLASSGMRAYALLCCSAIAAIVGVRAKLELCDSQCQDAQRTALQVLYTETGGSRWHRAGGWTMQPCGSACEHWPQHCGWSGVHCCLPAGVLGSGSPHFPSNAAINCTMVGGVCALLLNKENMHGSIPEKIWPSLAGSLKYLDFAGDS